VSCKAHGENKSEKCFSYIAVDEKAVVNDKERYMTKLAGAVPNKLEDTRFVFVGNYSPERVGYLEAKSNGGIYQGELLLDMLLARRSYSAW
jgi:hypothetical protein